MTNRNVSIITDINNKKLVIIKDIIFKGKRKIAWKDVEKYIKHYVGEFYSITESNDTIYIGAEFPDEYTGSIYTRSLKGTTAKAKANAAQAIPELIEIATDKHFKENISRKHKWNARNGWYRYNSRFGLPVCNNNGNAMYYNIFHASMLVRHANDGNLYLYDILDIKKETSNPLESYDFTQKKPIS